MKFEEFDTSLIDNFVNQEIDSFITDKELNHFVKYVYKIGTPKREKTYLMTQIAESLGLDDKSKLLPFAAAAELMMASAMNADDSIDSSHTRYNNKTLWLELGKDKTHIISNYMYGLLFKILDKYCAKEEGKQYEYNELRNLLMSYFFVMHHAQYSSMSLSSDLGNFSLDEMEKLAEEKASILFEFCTYTPALLLGEFKKEMREFGRLFGIALQYSSDIRDFIKLDDDLDKSNIRYEDVYTHQPNLVLVLTAKSDLITKEERDLFIEIWTTLDHKDKEKEEQIYSIILKSNSISESKKVLKAITNKMSDLINILPKESVRMDLNNLIGKISNF